MPPVADHARRSHARQFHRRPLGQRPRHRILRCPQSGGRRHHRPHAAVDRRRCRRRGAGRGAGVSRRGATRRSTRARSCSTSSRRCCEQHFEELARTVTTEHGKTLDEARGSVRRGIECVEVACGAPSLMQGFGLEDISAGVDCHVVRQPLGVVAAIAPFNFPAMVPMWFLPFAIVTGNTFVLKPSEQVPLSQRMMVDLLQQCDLPPGVVNLVNGGRDVVERDLRSPGHPRRVVRRLDAGRAARLPARHARRQARAGARRREELRRRDAGRRLRPRRSTRSPNRSTAARASAAWRAAC